MATEILTFDDLRRISRLGMKAQLATVERWANRIGLRYNYDGAGGIWTTSDAMNAAVGVSSDTSSQTYQADAVV